MKKTPRSYLEVFPTIFSEILERQNRRIEIIRSKNYDPKNLEDRLDLLARSYETLGLGECILHADAQKSKQYFYLSAKLRELLIINYDNEGPITVDASSVAMNNYRTLFRALLSDCDELIDSLAHLIGGRPEAESVHGHPFADNVGYAMKYILLDDYTKAHHHVEQLTTLSNDPDLRFVQGYAPVLHGIILSDNQLVTNGLALQLQLHKQDPDHQDQPEELFALHVLGLAKLAVRQGIEVILDDPLTPQVLLQKHNIDYPPLDFLPIK